MQTTGTQHDDYAKIQHEVKKKHKKQKKRRIAGGDEQMLGSGGVFNTSICSSHDKKFKNKNSKRDLLQFVQDKQVLCSNCNISRLKRDKIKVLSKK